MGCGMPTRSELFLSRGIDVKDRKQGARPHAHGSELDHLKAMFLDLVTLAPHRKATQKVKFNVTSLAFTEGS